MENKKAYVITYRDYEDVSAEGVLLGPADADLTALREEYEKNHSSFDKWLVSQKGFERVETYE